jgi:integrase
MWIEQKGRQQRVYWRTATGRDYEPLTTRQDAEKFRAAAKLLGPETARDLLRSAAGNNPADQRPAVQTPATVAPTTGALTIRELVEWYWQQKSGVPERTRTDAKAMLDNHIVPYFGDVDVRLLRNKVKPRRAAPIDPEGKPMSITGWVNWLADRSGLDCHGQRTGTTLSAKSIRNLHALLSAAFQSALEDDEDDAILARNPCMGTDLPEVQRGEQPFLEHAHFQALLQEMTAWFRPLLVFLVATGVRWGEVAGLQVKHVHLDPDSGQPHVQILVAWRRGPKGVMQLGRVKTKASQRKITLSTMAVEALRPLLAGKAPTDRVFTMRGGGHLHHGNFTRRHLVPAVNRAVAAGVDAGIRPHSFRHTHAAWVLSAGVGPTIVQKRLGHENESTTTKIYGHHTVGADEAALSAVETALAGLLGLDGDLTTVNALEQPEEFLLDPADAALPELDDEDEEEDQAA